MTDTTNVTAAGALMDSEVTNLAQVKAFDSSDYATAAQGTTADAALPKAGGAMTGAITTNSTFDGRDVATDGTKLDGIEASADVTDTANVTSAGALMDSELTAIASVKALNQGVATGDSPTFTNLTLSGTGSVKVPAGTTAQRSGSPAAGMFRYNSSLEQFEGYTSEWGSIGGGGGTNTFTTDSFTGNGSTTAYALSQVTSSEDNLLVFIEGVFQQQDAYSIATASGTTTLTFSAAPANGNAILIYSVASAVSGSNLNIDSMTGDGSDVTLTLSISPVNENNTQVFIDGVYQSKSNYSISGTTLTFSTAPPTGTAVEVMTFTQTDINVPVDGTVTSAKLSGDLTTPGALTVTGTTIANTSGGVVTLGTSGHVTSKQSLDVATAGGRFIGSSNRGILGQIRIEQTANSTDGGYIAFDTSPSGSTSPTEAMRISGGRVGIGGSTITDSNLLNIQGSSVSVNVGVVFNDTNTSKIFAIQNGGSALKFFDYTASAERMRLTTAGDLYFGQTSGSGASVGHIMQANGVMFHTRDGGTVQYLRRLNSDGAIVEFNRDGTTVGSLLTSGGRFAFIGNKGGVSAGFDFEANTKALRPVNGDGTSSDNTHDIGRADVRWKDIRATNGTIQTSDRNEKQDIETLSDAEQRVAVAAKGLMRKFRWIDAVETKGDNARIHFGIIAQDLQDAFTAEGLNAGRYAMFISDTWWETQTEVAAVEATEDTEAVDAYTRTDTYDTAEEAPEGATERTRLGVRYSELLAFIIAAI